MNEAKRKRLIEAGWDVTTVSEFLDLSDEEEMAIEREVDRYSRFYAHSSPKYVQELENFCRRAEIYIDVDTESKVITLNRSDSLKFYGVSAIFCDISVYHLDWRIDWE